MIADRYWETRFFPAQAMLACVLMLLSIVAPRAGQKACLLVSSLLLMGLPVPWHFGMEAIPGGDDGPGLGWALFVGGIMLIATAAGVAGLITWLVVTFKRGKLNNARPPHFPVAVSSGVSISRTSAMRTAS